MKVYDSVLERIASGETAEDATKRFALILGFMQSNKMLNAIGEKFVQNGFNGDFTLNDMLVNSEGLEFLENYYSKISSLSVDDLYDCCFSDDW